MQSYIYLIIQTLLFSFGGMAIKLTGNFLSPFMTSFCRFAIGSVILILIQLFCRKPVRLSFNLLIILGGLFKALHYMAENYGVMAGYSYGTVFVLPAQTLTVLLFGLISGTERPSARKIIGTLLTVVGVIIASVNGAPLSEFLSGQGKLLALLSLGGIGAGLFNICQKKLIDKTDAITMNLSMFLVGALVCLPSLFLSGPIITGSVTPLAILGLSHLGGVTAIGFLLQALAMRKLSALVATIIQSFMAILTVLWSAVLFKEPVTLWVVGGTIIFVIGILAVNIKQKAKA